MARTRKTDTLLFSATLLLLVVGMAWVYSASAVLAERTHNDEAYFLIRQLLWTALGVVCLMIAMRVDYRLYRRSAVLVPALVVTGLGLVAVFFCRPVNYSHRWLGVGSIGVQPSEFAKLLVIILLAIGVEEWLARGKELPRHLVLRTGGVLALFVALIYKEPDAGTALALIAVAATMVFAAGIAWKWVVGLGLVVPPAVYAFIILEGYRAKRIAAWLNPSADPLGDGFQPMQSMIAVGTGGVWGRGFMRGVQQMFYLYAAHNDFIYAVIAEEQGLIGATIVLLLFCVVAWRGLRIAARVPDAYGSMLALGITAMLGLQALVNMSVVLNLLPAKGIALPFVSAGGSSMVVSLTAMGMLLNMSSHAVE